MLYNTTRHRGTRIALAVLGSLIYSVGINYFVTPAGLYTGGFLGVGQIIRTLLIPEVGLDFGSLDVAGLIYFALNIPVYLIAFRSISGHFGLKSLLCTVCNTAFLSLLTPPAEPILYDVLASSILGGMIAGAGIGLMLYDGGSSGGMDILGVYLMKKAPGMSVGRINMTFNTTLYIICLILFSPQVAIYSIIYSVFCGLIADRLHQQNIAVMVWVFSKRQDDALRDYVTGTLHRSVTYWPATGAYQHNETNVMCICMSKYELEDFRHAMLEIDPDAFLVTDEGVRVHGNYRAKI